MKIDVVLQAEDCIRDKLVTGVQTCALPISSARPGHHPGQRGGGRERAAREPHGGARLARYVRRAVPRRRGGGYAARCRSDRRHGARLRGPAGLALRLFERRGGRHGGRHRLHHAAPGPRRGVHHHVARHTRTGDVGDQRYGAGPGHEGHGHDRRARRRRGAAASHRRSRARERRGDRQRQAGRERPAAGLSGPVHRAVRAVSARTLTELFFGGVERYADHPAAFRYKADGAWRAVTHREVVERVQALGAGLLELGIRPGDRVAILAETRLEWALADYACLCVRAADVPIYPTLPANQAEYILRDSGAVAVVCSTAAQVAKVRAVRGALPALRHVIAFEPAAGEGVMSLAQVEASGRAAASRHGRFQEDALAVAPTDLATLIYTSGTTGQPKGVMLTHRHICSNVRACIEVLRVTEDASCLAWLPLSHILERMVEYYFFDVGVTINYAESVDTVAQNLQEVRPSVVVAVPRLYEKGHARRLESAGTGGALKRRTFPR